MKISDHHILYLLPVFNRYWLFVLTITDERELYIKNNLIMFKTIH